jgi:hypothetical protein
MGKTTTMAIEAVTKEARKKAVLELLDRTLDDQVGEMKIISFGVDDQDEIFCDEEDAKTFGTMIEYDFDPDFALACDAIYSIKYDMKYEIEIRILANATQDKMENAQ